MINVLGVAFERRPGAGSSPAHQAFALLEREGWEPEHARLRMLVAPCRWWGSAELIMEAASGADAVVLFGSRKARQRALVARFARNEAKANAADGAGYFWPGSALAPGAVPLVPAPYCAYRLARAMEMAGLPSKPTVACDRYVYNHCYYRLLSETRMPPAMLVRMPLSVESARAEGLSAHVNRMQIVAGAAAALSFVAAAVEAERTPIMTAKGNEADGAGAGQVKLAS
jgi:pyrrolidone-carboxylate peptidase